MKKIFIIKSIHKVDAFYDNRREFIGEKIMLAGYIVNNKRGYVGGQFRFINKKLNKIYGVIIFYSVKLEEVIT